MADMYTGFRPHEMIQGGFSDLGNSITGWREKAKQEADVQRARDAYADPRIQGELDQGHNAIMGQDFGGQQGGSSTPPGVHPGLHQALLRDPRVADIWQKLVAGQIDGATAAEMAKQRLAGGGMQGAAPQQGAPQQAPAPVAQPQPQPQPQVPQGLGPADTGMQHGPVQQNVQQGPPSGMGGPPQPGAPTPYMGAPEPTMEQRRNQAIVDQPGFGQPSPPQTRVVQVPGIPGGNQMPAPGAPPPGGAAPAPQSPPTYAGGTPRPPEAQPPQRLWTPESAAAQQGILKSLAPWQASQMRASTAQSGQAAAMDRTKLRLAMQDAMKRYQVDAGTSIAADKLEMEVAKLGQADAHHAADLALKWASMAQKMKIALMQEGGKDRRAGQAEAGKNTRSALGAKAAEMGAIVYKTWVLSQANPKTQLYRQASPELNRALGALGEVAKDYAIRSGLPVLDPADSEAPPEPEQ
jgi:hypothetical protein